MRLTATYLSHLCWLTHWLHFAPSRLGDSSRVTYTDAAEMVYRWTFGVNFGFDQPNTCSFNIFVFFFFQTLLAGVKPLDDFGVPETCWCHVPIGPGVDVESGVTRASAKTDRCKLQLHASTDHNLPSQNHRTPNRAITFRRHAGFEAIVWSRALEQ